MNALLTFVIGLAIGRTVEALARPTGCTIDLPTSPQIDQKVIVDYPGIGWTNAIYQGGGVYLLERHGFSVTNITDWRPRPESENGNH